MVDQVFHPCKTKCEAIVLPLFSHTVAGIRWEADLKQGGKLNLN
jgi:hypothetical protein